MSLESTPPNLCKLNPEALGVFDMPSMNRRDAVKLGAASVTATMVETCGSASSEATHEYSFHRDHIIGTSFDLWLAASNEMEAERAESAALTEIERLRRIFSTFEPASELSRLNRTVGSFTASDELLDVLRAYELWQQRTGGALHGQVGELVRVWSDAEKAGRAPEGSELNLVATKLRRPGWQIDESTHSVTRLTDQPLNLNSIAKGFIIHRAGSAILEQVPTIGRGLLNIGGDMTAWGGVHWPLAIQNPHMPYDNATPLASVILTDAAIATSGGYQRYYTINGTRYSHIIDPRTGRPAGAIAGATVIAPDSPTANALATALCVLTPAEGLRLVASVPTAECLIVASDGRQFRSPGMALLPVSTTRTHSPTSIVLAEPWPEGYQATVTVTLPSINANKYRRPYVAVWIEDADGKTVRTLAVWGNSNKYLKDLNDWWKIGKDNSDLVKAVAKATRGPGKYELVWDGKDDKGNAVEQGTYMVRVEVHREYGQHLRQSGKIDCKTADAKLSLEKNAETDATSVVYAKKK